MKRTNHVQSAYINTFRAYALNVVARTPMPDDFRKAVKNVLYDVTLPLYEVVKCSKQQAWNNFSCRFIGKVRTIAGETKESQKIISTLEKHLKEK